MKTKNCAQYTEKKKRTEGHKLQSPKRDTYSLPGKSAPFTTQRVDSGSLLVQPHHHTLSQPSSHRRVTGLGQQSSRELRGQRHRRNGPWRFGQGFSGRDNCELPGVGPGYQNSFEGSLVRGLDQCHRDKSFRQGVQVRGRRRCFKRRRRNVRNRSQTQTKKSQSSGFRGSGSQSVCSRECKCPHFHSPQSECQGWWSGSISTHDCTTSCLSSLGPLRCPSTDELISEAVKNFLKLDATLSIEDTLKETTNVAESLEVCSSSQHPTCETTMKERGKASRWDVQSTETTLRPPDDGKPTFETTIKEKGKASRWDVMSAETTLRLPDDGKPTIETTIKERGKASRWDVPSAETETTLRLPDDGKPTFETTIKEKGKASRWDVASTETTLRLPDDGKEQTDSERVEAYEQQRRRLLILSGTISSTDPSVRACQSLCTPSGDASAVLTPLQAQDSACITTDKQIKKVSAGISKFKEKPTALGSPYAIHEQKQVNTGKVTELFLETDDDLDIKLDIQPPASQKAQRRKFQMQQFPKKSPKNESCKLPDHLKTQQVRSLHALALDIVSNNDLNCHTVNTVTGPQTENQIIAPQKEFSFGASNEFEESDHSPWRKGPLCTPDSSPLKGKTPETTTGHEAIRSLTIGDHRRIVKIKPKHPRSSSTTDRRLIKVKSHQTSFKDILSSESHESGSNPTCQVKNHTDEEHVEEACVGSERETAATGHDADETQTRDFDFSSLFPYSQSEGRHLIDILDHKCSQATSSPEETDEEVQCRESEETQVCESSQSSCYQYSESSYTEQQFEYDDDNQPVIPEREFDSLYLGEEADLLEDGPDVFTSSHCHITEETYTEDLDTGSDYPSQIDDCEIHSDKETDNCDIEGDEKIEPGRVQNTSPPMSVSLENKFSQPRLSIPFVHKAKKDSLTSVKERDKLKALFSVRKKGSLKLTAKAGCLGAGKIQDVENIDKYFESVNPSEDENFSDLEQKDTETGSQKSSGRTSESAENASVETEQNLPVVTDMSYPASHAECADPVHKNSEECVLSSGVILAQTDHQDLSLQLHSPTQRRKHESPEYFDGAEQKSQADMIIDDDEILREIDSCLATHRSSHDDKVASVNLMESEKFVRPETTDDFLAASTVSVETNTVTEKCASYPSYEINAGISKQGDLSSHKKLIGHGNLDEGCSGISVDESNALTAAVSGLTVEDEYESDCPENVASVSSECDGVPQSLFGPSISFSASASFGKALSDQSPSPGSRDIFPAGGSEKTKAAEGKHQIVQIDRAHETEIVSTVSSQSVLTSDPACPYVQLEQDPSGVTDVSIFIDITGDQTTTNENECDGCSSLPAESTTLQPERMGWHTARTEEEQVQCTDISTRNEEEFVTTCFSLVVPRNKLLDISFEPVMKSGLSSDDKNIEIEVMAESETSLENVKLAEVLNMAHLSHAECPESQVGDTGCKQVDDRLDFPQDSLPQTAESLELGDTGCKQVDDRLDFPQNSLPQTAESLELGDTGCKQIDDRLDFPQDSLPQTAESLEFEVNDAKPGNGAEKIIQTGSMKEGHKNLDEERETVNSKSVSSVQHDQSAEDVEQGAVGMEVEVTAESTAETESGGAGTNVTSSSSLEIEPSVSHLEVDSLPTHSPETSAEMYEVEGGGHYAAEGIDERQLENSVTVTEALNSHDRNEIEDSLTVTEALNSHDRNENEDSLAVTEALNSHDRNENEDSLAVTEALNSHDRSKNEDTAPETCRELQIMPSSSYTGVAGGLEVSAGEQYPSSPPCLIHCSEFDHVDSSGSTSSPPVLKPQTTLSTSENLSNSSPHLPSLNLTVTNFEQIGENTVSQMVHISEKSCQSIADSFRMAAMTDISSLSSVEYCVTSVVASPVMSLAVVDDGSRDAGCVDVVSDEPPSATHSSSPPDLFPASSATSQAQAARSASHDMDDLGDPCSDDNENKSPVSYDSDDSLGDEPGFLSSVIGSSTPLSTVNPNVPAQAGQGSTGSTVQSHHQLTTFSLDSLLRDTRKAEAEERETLAIQAKLRKELLSGEPYAQEENENDEMDYDDFTDEQKCTLRKLRLEEEEIRDCAPGESILSDPLWGQLFTESVSPAACGVHMGSSHTCLRQLFSDYQPNTLMDILSSDIISLTYHSMPCKSEIQRWLFFIMSVHGSAVEVRKCGDQLHQVLQWQMGDQRQKHTWTPSLIDLFRVFVNWGADLKDPVFDTFAVDPHQLEQKLRLENSQPHQGGPPIQCPRNFEAVLKMLVSWLQARPGYSTQELNQLLLMLCRLSLDHSLCKMYILTELQICLASLLECYQPSEWKSVVPWLCRKLSGLSSHHHNQVYITKLLSSVCPRSCYLQQRLAFLLLYSALTSKQLSDQQIHQFKLADLLALIPEFRHVLQNDNYHVASLVQLLDLSVGPAAHHVSQRKQLFQLLEAVRLIISEIRDSMMRLDCTKVKGMLLHLCLKWDLAVKSNNVKQRKIFSCLASMTQSMPVEQLTDQGLATNEDDNTVDSAVSFSDSDLNEEDTTVPRVKMLKRDSGSGDVKNHGDGDKHQVLAQASGDCSVESIPSRDGGCGENSRLSIFETFRLNKANDLASGDGDVEADETVGTPRCGEAGNSTAGTLDSPAERGTASDTPGLLGSDRPDDVHTDGFMCPNSTGTVSDDDSLPNLQ